MTDFSQKILAGLNDRQLEATTSTSGPILVIAGAGSGKTAVLTRRIAYLISQGVTPGRVLAVTFTNKAAREMQERVIKQLADAGHHVPNQPIWVQDYENTPLVSTFHSLGVRLLREFGEYIDLPSSFSILDTDDQKRTVRQIMKDLNLDQKKFLPNTVLNFISKCKQELLLAKDSHKLTQDYMEIFHKIYKRYEDQLKSSKAVDFDDLILLPYILLDNNQEVRDLLQNRWQHVLVDEFQDTNTAQFKIISLLSPPDLLDADIHRSLFVVGDDAQSIYAFRGSRIEIILNFESSYPGTREIILNQNYRSTQAILDLAEKILSHNQNQKKKELFTQNPEAHKVYYYLARNEQDEAEYIVRQIYNQYVDSSDTELEKTSELIELNLDPGDSFEVDSFIKPDTSNDPVSSMFDVYLDETESISPSLSKYSPSSWVPEYKWGQVEDLNKVAVLYRTHAQSRSLEETFLKYNLPYKLVSGVRFLDRREIKDVLAMLRFLANGEDKVSLSRFLPLITTGVGAKTMEKIIAYLEDYEYPLAPKYQQLIIDLITGFQGVWNGSEDLIDLTKKLIQVSGYEAYLKKEYPARDEFNSRMENLGEMYSLMYPFDEDKNLSLSDRLKLFLEHVALMSNHDNNIDNTPKISLMSLHQSKGLEFETVFLVGVEDGILPHQNSFFETDGMAEEVRLAYVGVTRAKKFLHLVAADSRIQFGQVKMNPVSRIFRPFLDNYCQRQRV